MVDTQVEKAKTGSGNGTSNGRPGISLSVDAMLKLSSSMDSLTDELRAERERHQRISQAIHPIVIPPNQITITANAGTLNQPNLYGPRRSNFWDVRRIQVSNFTAGTVTVYLNANGGEILALFTPVSGAAPPPQYFGSGQVILGQSDFLIFVAAGITGTPTVSLAAIEVGAEWIGDYLL